MPIIEIHVQAGARVQAEDPLLTLESDKATLDVPAPQAGTVTELKVAVGDRVGEGSVILLLEPEGAAATPPKEKVKGGGAPGSGEPATYGSSAGAYETIEVKVPDIGDFKDVPVIEVHVAEGATVKAEDPLLTLESDKATMDVPSPAAGTVRGLKVKVGDRVGEGTLILLLETGAAKPAGAATVAAAPAAPATAPTPKPATGGKGDYHAEVLVLGAGPGGYTAAFRAADLGRQVVLVERWPSLGGVCLNVGCIPSKALLHAAKVIAETQEMGCARPDLRRAHDRPRRPARLEGRRGQEADRRPVRACQAAQGHRRPGHRPLHLAQPARGRAARRRAQDRDLRAGDHRGRLRAGAAAVHPARRPAGDRLAPVPWSWAAFPKRLLVVGGGIIGLEMATVYHALGAKVTIVELMDQIIPGADKDLVTPLHKRIAKQYENIFLKAKVTRVEARPEGLVVSFEGGSAPATDTFDQILVAVGRKPNGKLIGAENAGVIVDERGFVPVDKQMRTNVAHIFAIGDVVGQPMLAHKAVHEGKVAAEAASGLKSFFDATVIPSVAYTDPEVAWVGLTENEAKAKGIKYGKGVFPWAASGRSLSLGRDEGSTKLLFDEATDRILGCGIVGPNAGDLIAEAAPRDRDGCRRQRHRSDHPPHPTLSETIGMAAEMFEGTITDLIAPKKKH